LIFFFFFILNLKKKLKFNSLNQFHYSNKVSISANTSSQSINRETNAWAISAPFRYEI